MYWHIDLLQLRGQISQTRQDPFRESMSVILHSINSSYSSYQPKYCQVSSDIYHVVIFRSGSHSATDAERISIYHPGFSTSMQQFIHDIILRKELTHTISQALLTAFQALTFDMCNVDRPVGRRSATDNAVSITLSCGRAVHSSI